MNNSSSLLQRANQSIRSCAPLSETIDKCKLSEQKLVNVIFKKPARKSPKEMIKIGQESFLDTNKARPTTFSKPIVRQENVNADQVGNRSSSKVTRAYMNRKSIDYRNVPPKVNSRPSPQKKSEDREQKKDIPRNTTFESLSGDKKHFTVSNKATTLTNKRKVKSSVKVKKKSSKEGSSEEKKHEVVELTLESKGSIEKFQFNLENVKEELMRIESKDFTNENQQGRKLIKEGLHEDYQSESAEKERSLDTSFKDSFVNLCPNTGLAAITRDSKIKDSTSDNSHMPYQEMASSSLQNKNNEITPPENTVDLQLSLKSFSSSSEEANLGNTSPPPFKSKSLPVVLKKPMLKSKYASSVKMRKMISKSSSQSSIAAPPSKSASKKISLTKIQQADGSKLTSPNKKTYYRPNLPKIGKLYTKLQKDTMKIVQEDIKDIEDAEKPFVLGDRIQNFIKKHTKEKFDKSWSHSIPVRRNQDIQREYEEKIMKILEEKTAELCGFQKFIEKKVPSGGIYLTLEDEWKSENNIRKTPTKTKTLTCSPSCFREILKPKPTRKQKHQ